LSVVARTVCGMNLSMGSITIDCAEPRALAEFWTQALDLEVAFDADGHFMSLRSRTNPSQPAIGLQKVPEEKAVKNRVHIDFMTDDPDGEIARLVALGAAAGEKHEVPGLTWTVLSDPVGNEFCVGSEHS
jgi:predicted enzyme related to lactoylglutathione lyase